MLPRALEGTASKSQGVLDGLFPATGLSPKPRPYSMCSSRDEEGSHMHPPLQPP
jgi:hypothetical protein